MRKYQRNWFEIAENHNWIKELKILWKYHLFVPLSYPSIPLAGLGRHAVYPSRKLAKSGDYDQPDPPAGPRGHEVSSSRSGRIQGTVVSLIRYPGRSRGHKSAEPQSWQVSGHQVCRAANPGTHGPSVPETREANVKCTDVTGNNLDVRRHHHIRRQHKPKAT